MRPNNKLYVAFLKRLAQFTECELAKVVQFQKEENVMMREQLPGRLRLTPQQRQRLLKYGKARAKENDQLEDVHQVALGRAGGRRLYDGRSLDHARARDVLPVVRDGTGDAAGAFRRLYGESPRAVDEASRPRIDGLRRRFLEGKEVSLDGPRREIHGRVPQHSRTGRGRKRLVAAEVAESERELGAIF